MVFFDLVEKPLLADSEHLRCLLGPASIIVEGVFNRQSFRFLQTNGEVCHLSAAYAVSTVATRLHTLRKVLQFDLIPVGHDCRVLQNVGELTNVARVMVREKRTNLHHS